MNLHAPCYITYNDISLEKQLLIITTIKQEWTDAGNVRSPHWFSPASGWTSVIWNLGKFGIVWKPTPNIMAYYSFVVTKTLYIGK